MKPKINQIINDEVIIIMNMKKIAIKLIINGKNKGELNTQIPIIKPLFPEIFLYYKDNSVKLWMLNMNSYKLKNKFI